MFTPKSNRSKLSLTHLEDRLTPTVSGTGTPPPLPPLPPPPPPPVIFKPIEQPAGKVIDLLS